MIKKIIKEVIELLKKNNSNFGDDVIINDKFFKISKDNFQKIHLFDSDKEVAFIDGGNQEILGAANFSLQLIRTYYCIFKNNKKNESRVFNFFILINTINNNGLKYEVRFFCSPLFNQNIIFDSFDKTISYGKRAEIPRIADAIRRFAELKTAILLNKEFNGIIVLDGDLQSSFTYEEDYLKELFNSLNGNILCALSKTIRLFTKNGNSLVSVLNANSPYLSWYYPLDNLIFFVKLNDKSDYIFKLEIYKDYNINEILSLLFKNSKDPSFIGYPYGLIDADKFARISNKERDSLRIMFMSSFGKEFKKIKLNLNTINAHNILDKLAF